MNSCYKLQNTNNINHNVAIIEFIHHFNFKVQHSCWTTNIKYHFFKLGINYSINYNKHTLKYKYENLGQLF